MANLIEIIVTATDETAPAFDSARAGADSLGESAGQTGNKLEEMGASGEQAAAEVGQVGGESENASAGVERLGTSGEQTAAKVERLGAAAEHAGASAATASSGTDSLAASTQRVGKESSAADDFLRRVAASQEEFDKQARAGAMSADELARGIGAAGKEAGTAGREAEKLGADVEKVGGASSNAARDLGQMAKSLDGAVNGLMAAHPIITAIIALLPMLGGVVLAAGVAFETLAVGAGVVILGFNGIKAAVSEMLPALHALEAQVSGVFQQDLSKPFSELGHVLTALTPQFKDVADAIAGIIQQFIPTRQAVEQIGGVLQSVAGFFREGAKGASDLAAAVGTMAEAAAPELKDIADGINHIYEAWKTAVQELSKTGELQQAFSAVAGGLRAFGDALAAVMTVLTQITATAGPQLNQIVSQLSEALKAWGPAIASFVKGLDDLFAGLGPVLTLLGKLASAISPLFDVLGNGVGVILAVVGATKAWTIAMAALDLVMDANPIVLALAAIVLLIGGIVTLTQDTGDFGKTWNDAWGNIGDGIKSIVDAIMTPINAIINAIKSIVDALSTLNQALGGSPIGGGLSSIGGIPGHATGGIGSGVSIVGENGPELVNLPGGSTISSNSDLSAMMTGGGSSGTDRFTLVAQAGADSYVATMIMGLMRSGQIQIRKASLV